MKIKFIIILSILFATTQSEAQCTDVPTSKAHWVGTSSDTLILCGGDQAKFENFGSTHNNGATGNLIKYVWRINGGEDFVSVEKDTIQTYPFTVGLHTIDLAVEDDSSCWSSFSTKLLIQVLPAPDIDTIRYFHCDADTFSIGFVPSIHNSNDLKPDVFIDTICLPDSTGSTHRYSYYITNYGNSTISSGNQFELCLNIEHGSIEDFQLRIVCPNGQSALIHDTNSVSMGLGFPDSLVANSNYACNYGAPGEGADYCFSNNYSPLTLLSWGLSNINSTFVPSGNYSSVGGFNSLVGCPIDGSWTIEYTDFKPINDGAIFSADFNFNINPFPISNLQYYTDTTLSFWELNSPIILSRYSNADSILTHTNGLQDTLSYIITNNAGCSYTIENIISPIFELNYNQLIKPDCDSSKTGFAIIDATDAGALSQLNWFGENIYSAFPGVYKFELIDTNNCSTFGEVTIDNNMIIIDSVDVIDTRCYGTNDGSIEFYLDKNYPPYRYDWYGIDSSILRPGRYTVTIFDSLDCFLNYEFVVAEPDSMYIQLEKISKDNGGGGEIDISIVGGTPPYSFNWSNNLISEDIKDSPGSYTVIVKDVNDCEVTATYSIEDGLNTIFRNQSEIKIYPNPTNGQVNINVNMPFSYSIYNLVGELIEQSDSQNNKVKLNLNSGIYLIEIKTNLKEYRSRLIVL